MKNSCVKSLDHYIGRYALRESRRHREMLLVFPDRRSQVFFENTSDRA